MKITRLDQDARAELPDIGGDDTHAEGQRGDTGHDRTEQQDLHVKGEQVESPYQPRAHDDYRGVRARWLRSLKKSNGIIGSASSLFRPARTGISFTRRTVYK